MRSLILILCIPFVFSCVSGPKNNKEFSDTNDLSELVGIYNNLGETPENFELLKGWGKSRVYLSGFIWKNQSVKHSSINKIRVSIINSNSIKVEALYDSTIIKESIFVRGKHFELNNGSINITSSSQINTEGSILNSGIESKSQEIGIDTKGDVKYRENTTYIGGGLSTLFFPMTISNSNDVRFRRISK